ncbi:MAG: Xaa-Pro peptidase family protein [Candidatus Symbiothrix sp.]|jgi:Xaa-Pro aminopeptidase|nr:Xaa-Pro peptidase family protein [Candidatus Symbiothrix sp.]
MHNNTSFPPPEDLLIRRKQVQSLLAEQGADACLIHSFVNIYYLAGRAFDGYIYLPREGSEICFVRKAGTFEDEKSVPIRKPEDLPALLKERSIPSPRILGLETDQLNYNECLRLQATFNPEKTVNATHILRRSRMIKTAWEIEQFRYSALRHSEVYEKIPSLFRHGMCDLDFQYEIENTMRRHGSIGIFRAAGSNMDIFMGSLLTGDNAAIPSPCDFALGGAGPHACLPIGASGNAIRPGQAVMVDMAGNFTAYMTDMTRVFACGALPEAAYEAHRVSIDMHGWLMENGKPGLSCARIYEQSLMMAQDAGFAECFMGTVQQAKFTGHGVGIEINELPVLTGRSKDVLQAGMMIAFEPKFVLPGTGALGIENTYLVTETGMEKITVFNENIIPLP